MAGVCLMARIRSVHPKLFTDEAFVGLSDAAKWFFIGLWTEADDQGVFEWKPMSLQLRIAPASMTPVEPILSELERADRVRRYEIDGRQLGAIRNFTKYQKPKSPKCIYPITEKIRSYLTSAEAISEVRPAERPPIPQKGEINFQREEGGGNGKEDSGQQNLVSARPAGLPETSFSKICQALGGFEAVRTWTNLQTMVAHWVGESDLDADILPTIREVLAKRGGKLPNSASYFSGAIKDHRERRLAGKTNGHASKPIEVDYDEWFNRLRAFHQFKSWAPSWGPKPHEPGCHFPERIRTDFIAQYGSHGIVG